MSVKSTLVFFILLLFTTSHAYAGVTEYPCYRLDSEPVLDGRIDNNVWENIPAFSGFYIIRTEEYAQKQTWFKAGWTDEAVYIALRAEDPSAEKIDAVREDGGPLWGEDSFEIFFAPDGKGKYFQLILNAIGSRTSYQGPERRELGWQVETEKGEDYWSAEVKVPIEIFENAPRASEKWHMNIARNMRTGPEAERWTTWAPGQNAFNEIENFGMFKFKDKTITPARASEIEKSINVEAFATFKKRIFEAVEKFEQNRGVLEEGKEIKKFRENISLIKDKGVFLRESWKEIEQQRATEIVRASVKAHDFSIELEDLVTEIQTEMLFLPD